jgi:hypothetical protein
MARQKRFLSYKGVVLYETRDSTYWYALIPNTDNVGGGNFDIRRLPRRYRQGQKIELDLSAAEAPPSAGYVYEAEKAKELMAQNDEVHRDVFRRAIDDGYDFNSATEGNYSQFFRRLKRWVSKS